MGAHGQGFISRRADGRLAVRLTREGREYVRYVPSRLVQRDPRGARKLAERYLAELVEWAEADEFPTRQPLAAYLRSWLDELDAAPRRRPRPKTMAGYRMIVEQHVIPALGHLRLDALRERHVQRWIDAMEGEPRTIRNRWAVLRRALNVAVRRRIIDVNPAIGIDLPAAADYQGAPLTEAEVRRLLRVTEGDRLHVLWRLAVVTGARLGELLGLAWDDIDGQRVRIVHKLARVDGRWVLQPPKTAGSVRSVSIDAATAALLEEHRLRLAAERTPDSAYFGLVFRTETGQPYHQSTVLNAFHAACERAGLERHRFHDLRVTSATLMRERGVPEDVRMSRLGHVTTSMARHYAVDREGYDKRAVEQLEEALG